VRRLVEPPVREVEADRAHELLPQRALRRGRERPLGRHGPRLARLLFQHPVDEIRQEPREAGEQFVDARGARAGLVLVEQRVVGREAARRAQRLRLFAREAQHLLERRQQHREVGGGPRRAPHRFARRARLRQRRHEVRGQRHGRGPGPAHLAQVRALPAVQARRFALGALQQLAHVRAGQQLVARHLEGRELLGARRDAAARHHHRHVPVQHALGLGEGAEPREAGFQLGVSGHVMGEVGNHSEPCSGMDLSGNPQQRNADSSPPSP
jgi:hypothetical protein